MATVYWDDRAVRYSGDAIPGYTLYSWLHYMEWTGLVAAEAASCNGNGFCSMLGRPRIGRAAAKSNIPICRAISDRDPLPIIPSGCELTAATHAVSDRCHSHVTSYLLGLWNILRMRSVSVLHYSLACSRLADAPFCKYYQWSYVCNPEHSIFSSSCALAASRNLPKPRAQYCSIDICLVSGPVTRIFFFAIGCSRSVHPICQCCQIGCHNLN